MHLPIIKNIVLWICKIILLVFGQPFGATGTHRAADKGREIYDQVKQAIHAPAEDEGPPKVKGLLSAIPAVRKLQDDAHAVKEAADTAKAVGETLKKGEEKIADTGEKVADAFKGAGDKAKDAVSGGFSRITDLWNGRKNEREKQQRDVLTVRAGAVGVRVDESWSFTELQARVMQAEAAAWRAKWNAQCPVCRRPMHVSDRMKRERIRCPGCQSVISGGTARSLGSPPPGATGKRRR
jgi:hypothetical protein